VHCPGAFGELSSEACLFAGDILTTGFYAAALTGIERGGTVAIVGAGPVGLCTALAVGLRDPAQVLILDADPARVDFVQMLGFVGLDVSGQDGAGAVADRTEGRMADVAVEAVGAPAAFKTAMRCARDGGRVVVVGVYGSERYELPMGKTWVRGLDLRFSGMANIHKHWDEALEAVATGTVDPTQLITHRLPLDDAEEGYELFRSRRAVKVVLSP
jgi:threonine dehydrogenase-like Zn-dependent dehydrogenase